MEKYQEVIFELYERSERNMAELYARFAELFPSDADFWKRMSAEEEVHAQWVSKLAAAVKRGQASFEEGKTRTYTLKSFIEHQEGLLATTKARGGFTRKSALTAALDMERSLIERQVFTHFTGSTKEQNALLEKLRMATEAHYRRFEKEWAEHRE